jgi:integrase
LDFCAARNVETTRRAKAFAFRLLLTDLSSSAPVTSITRQSALAFLSHVARERGGGSANDIKKRLSAAWRWGAEFLDMSEINPFRVPKFPADERPRYVPPLKDFKAVLALTSGADYAMLLTALHTAARRGEIFRLVWEDVDFGRGVLRLGTRKRTGGGMQYDWLPLTTELSKVLAAHKVDTGGGTGLVFPRRDGAQYKARSNMIGDLCARAGVNRFGFHGIRHLAASMMADNKNMSITKIQEILRHKSSLTTSRYLHRIGALQQDLDSVFCKEASGSPCKLTYGPSKNFTASPNPSVTGLP